MLVMNIPVPIVTPSRMLEFPPTHTLLPNVTGEVKRFPELKLFGEEAGQVPENAECWKMLNAGLGDVWLLY